jgi:hypothetical protein
MSVDSLTRVPLAAFLLASLLAATGAIEAMVLVTMGSRGGLFSGAFGSRYHQYFAIVILVVFASLICTRFFQLRIGGAIAACAAAGYTGGVLAYCYLAYDSLLEMYGREHYLTFARPFVLPTHLIFVVGGMFAALLTITLCALYGLLSSLFRTR